MVDLEGTMSAAKIVPINNQTAVSVSWIRYITHGGQMSGSSALCCNLRQVGYYAANYV